MLQSVLLVFCLFPICHSDLIQLKSTGKISRTTSFKSSLTSFIIGGHDSPQRPFFVQIMRRHRGVNHQICGGTIIHEDWILTAAHCVSRIDCKLPYQLFLKRWKTSILINFCEPMKVNFAE